MEHETATWRRRVMTVPGVFSLAVGLTVLAPAWLPLAALADLVRGRRRLPMARLLAFGWGWAWLESAGVAAAGGLWLVGRRRDLAAHYRLQRWWASGLMRVLERTTGLRILAADPSPFAGGPTVLLCRHASLADSLVSAWVITTLAGKRPRYVLKRELLADPCLDVVGQRVPNHFLDREATDPAAVAAELDALSALAHGLGDDDVAVIFPEGTRATPAKRDRALAKLADRDPERAARLRGLQHLLPPRPAGSAALLDGAPHADVVIGWHVGFDGLDSFSGILRHLASAPPPVQFASRRIRRSQVPTGDAFTTWLDEQWLLADAAVHAMLQSAPTPSVQHPGGQTPSEQVRAGAPSTAQSNGADR